MPIQNYLDFFVQNPFITLILFFVIIFLFWEDLQKINFLRKTDLTSEALKKINSSKFEIFSFKKKFELSTKKGIKKEFVEATKPSLTSLKNSISEIISDMGEEQEVEEAGEKTPPGYRF